MSLFAVKSPLTFAKAWNAGSAASPAHSRSTNTATSFMPPVSNPWTSSPLVFTKSKKPAIFSLPPASMSEKSPRSLTANSSAPSFAPPNPRAAATSSALPAAPEDQDAIALQRSISLHREFRPLHHGRGHPQPEGQTGFHRLQRRQLSHRQRKSLRPQATRNRQTSHFQLAQQELGRIRQARRTSDEFCLHGLRQRRSRNLSRLAGTTRHRPLGRPRSCRRRRRPSANRTRFFRCLCRP